MRDRIVFFVLGAVLATIAYLIGDLETLTAEEKITELDTLRVNRLQVRDNIVVGGTGKKLITMDADNESAAIILYGGERSNNHDDMSSDIKKSPTISLIAADNAAVIEAISHYKHPEATSTLAVVDEEDTQFESALMLKDSNGRKVIFSHH